MLHKKYTEVLNIINNEGGLGVKGSKALFGFKQFLIDNTEEKSSLVGDFTTILDIINQQGFGGAVNLVQDFEVKLRPKAVKKPAKESGAS